MDNNNNDSLVDASNDIEKIKGEGHAVTMLTNASFILLQEVVIGSGAPIFFSREDPSSQKCS